MSEEVKEDQKVTPDDRVVVIGEERYGEKEITDLKSELSKVREVLTGLTPVSSALARYNVDADTLIANAEHSFSTMTKLIEAGIINDKGELVSKQQKEMDSLKSGPTPKSESASVEEIINQALGGLGEKLATIETKVLNLDKTQESMIRMSLEKDILAAHPVLERGDIPGIIRSATQDRSKDIMQHAKDAVAQKEMMKLRMREELGKEYGIDFKKLDENRLNEPDPQKGASAFAAKNKMSLDGRKGTVAVRDLVAKYFKHSLRDGG